MATLLYDIFWSHYCEKARACLDFKRVAYTVVRVNPFTRRELTRLGLRGAVPVLADAGRIVEGSSEIAAYLEETRPEPPLLPREAGARAEALAWQRRLDDELGPDSRPLAYQVAFEHPALLLGTILSERPPGSWLNRPLLWAVALRLREKVHIPPRSLDESRARLRRLLSEMQTRVTRAPCLVGERPTVADLTAVALMDPLENLPEVVRDPAYSALVSWERGIARGCGRPQRDP